MLTSKQRAYLRGLANTESAIMQIGKGGIGENLVKCTWEVEDYELVSGYIFDGNSWWPAEATWDGWVPIHEDKEEEE